jgi:hypothetical protein
MTDIDHDTRPGYFLVVWGTGAVTNNYPDKATAAAHAAEIGDPTARVYSVSADLEPADEGLALG